MSRTQYIHMTLRWVDVKDTLHPQKSPMGGCQGHITSTGVSERDVKDTLHPQECRGWMSKICTSVHPQESPRVDVERRHMLVGAFSSIFHMLSLNLQPVADIDGEVKICFLNRVI